MRFPLSLDLLTRLPRHPDWKYELIDGEALLSPRPRPLVLRRPTAVAVPAVLVSGADVRPIDTGRDRAGIVSLLLDVWTEEDPYRSLEERDRDAALRFELERTVERPGELDGAVAVDPHGLCAAVLVSSSSCPTLSWLSVRRDVRDRGLATALLGVVVEALAERGVSELESHASAANLPSVRWHLGRGFELAPDPLRAALRDAADYSERGLTGVPPRRL